jgi:dihydroorotase
MKVRGWPVGTVLRGNVVMWEGQLLAGANGRPLRFESIEQSKLQMVEQV